MFKLSSLDKVSEGKLLEFDTLAKEGSSKLSKSSNLIYKNNSKKLNNNNIVRSEGPRDHS